MIYGYFLFVFSLTVLIECTIMFLIFRSKQFVYYIFLCNLLTNPALNLITIQMGKGFGILWYRVVLLILELAVVIIEARIIHTLCRFKAKKAILISFILNLASFCCGIIIIWFLIKK